MENRKVHFVLFALALLLAATNLFAPTLGFVAPVSGKAVGADLWAALAWLLFLSRAEIFTAVFGRTTNRESAGRIEGPENWRNFSRLFSLIDWREAPRSVGMRAYD
jgi:hypothetical protein